MESMIISMIVPLLGGVGLFLLGMVLTTDGLKSAAGDSLRRVLHRATTSQSRAILSGAGLTVLVQSSSATTLAMIGFVSAGILTFPRAIGVIFGATIGTTSTGWLVSLLGLKLSIGAAAMPMVGIGALMRLLGRGRWPFIGMAIAGFGLIFIGINSLKGSMETVAQQINPADLPTGSLLAMLLLVVIGIVMTVIMQSSGAAVATTMTALYSGAITFEQAAPMVIGQSIGTTATSAVAALGASAAARRTALAHVLFSVFAGAVAFCLLPVVFWLTNLAFRNAGHGPTPFALAVFHTSFNVLGVLLLLPVTQQFSNLLMRLIPEREQQLTRNLDRSIIEVSSVAIEAARHTTIEIARVVFDAINRIINTGQITSDTSAALDAANAALEETRHFLTEVRTEPSTKNVYERHVAVLHAMDHLSRLVEAAREIGPASLVSRDPQLRQATLRLATKLDHALQWFKTGDGEGPLKLIQKLSLELADLRRTERPRILQRTAAGQLDPSTAMRRLEAIRWIDRLAYHIWRTMNYLQEQPAGDSDSSATPPLDDDEAPADTLQRTIPEPPPPSPDIPDSLNA